MATLSPKDHFVYCPDCGDSFLDGCKSHPLVITLGSAFIGVGSMDEKDEDPLHVGVFNQSERVIKRATLLGPYLGEFINLHKYSAKEPKSGLAVEVLDSELTKVIGYIDPGDDLDPELHWASMMKTLPDKEQYNVAPVQYRGHIYFQVTKDIEPYEELLMSSEVDAERKLDIISRPSLSPNFNCPSCGIIVLERRALKRHLRSCAIKGQFFSKSLIKDDERGYQCDICKIWVKTWKDFKIHVKQSYFRRVELKCQCCTKVFGHPKNVERHMARCIQYNQNSRIRNSVKKKDHLPLRKNACPHCSKYFVMKSDIKRHIKSVHLQLRDQCCPHCNKAFSEKGTLHRHIKAVHLRDQQCPHCDKSFGKNGNLYRHIKAVHQQLCDQQCPYCIKTFFYTAHLNKHIKAIHRQLPDLPDSTISFSQESTLNFIISNKNRRKLLDNSHCYMKEKKIGEKTIWKCEMYYSLKCRARVHSDLHRIIKRVGEHNHPGNVAKIAAMQTVSSVKSSAILTQEGPDTIAVNALVGVSPAVAVELPSFKQLKRTIRYARKSISRPLPNQFSDSGKHFLLDDSNDGSH